MRRVGRVSFLALGWLFLAGVATQFLLAGMSLFMRPGIWETHIGVGFTIGWIFPLAAIAGLVGREPGRAWGRLGLLFLVYLVQTTLPSFRGMGLLLVAALHPLNALLVFWMTLVFIRNARAAVAELEGVRQAPAPAAVGPGALEIH